MRKKIISLSQTKLVESTSLDFKMDIGELVGKYLFYEKIPSIRASDGISGETFISEDLVFKFMTHPKKEDRLFSGFLEFWANNFMNHYYTNSPQVVLISEGAEVTQIIKKIQRENGISVEGPVLVFPRIHGLNIKAVLR